METFVAENHFYFLLKRCDYVIRTAVRGFLRLDGLQDYYAGEGMGKAKIRYFFSLRLAAAQPSLTT